MKAGTILTTLFLLFSFSSVPLKAGPSCEAEEFNSQYDYWYCQNQVEKIRCESIIKLLELSEESCDDFPASMEAEELPNNRCLLKSSGLCVTDFSDCWWSEPDALDPCRFVP